MDENCFGIVKFNDDHYDLVLCKSGLLSKYSPSWFKKSRYLLILFSIYGAGKNAENRGILRAICRWGFLTP